MTGTKNIVMTILMGAIATNLAIVQVVAAKSLTAKEVYNLASKFVVKIDGDKGGSGFIVSKNGNRYTVLTNDHVAKTSSQHTITTYDGKTYTSESVKSFKSENGLDLAEIEFDSNSRYQVAQLASKPDYSVGAKVYAVGWNATNSNLTQRSSNILEGTISGSQRPNDAGYTLKMNLSVVHGMSGSPLLDENGKVIGIYGQAIETITYGIQTSNYRKVTSSLSTVVDTAPIKRSPGKPRVFTTGNDSDQDAQVRQQPNSSISNSRTTSVDCGFKLLQSIPVTEATYGYSQAVISANATIIVIGGSSGFQIRQIANGEIIHRSDSDYGLVRSLAISTDGKIVAIGTDRGIEIRKTSNNEIIRQIDDVKAGYSIAMSGDGTTIAGTHLNDTIKVWRVSDGELIRTITAHNPYLSSVEIHGIAISWDARYIASVGINDSVRVWQISDGNLINAMLRGSAEFKFVNFGVNRNFNLLFAQDDRDGSIHTMDIFTGKLISRQKCVNELPLLRLSSVSANRRILVTTGDGRKLQIWKH